MPRNTLKNPNDPEINAHRTETENNSKEFISQKYVDERLQGISQQIKELSQKTPKNPQYSVRNGNNRHFNDKHG